MELLTVIVIIGILAAIIIPTAGKVRAHARQVKCAANTRQWLTAVRLYADEHRGKLPYSRFNTDDDTEGEGKEVMVTLMPYLNVKVNVANRYAWLTSNMCNPDAKWLHGFNSYMSKDPLEKFTQPSRQIYVMDLGNNARWIDDHALNGSRGTDDGKRLRYAHPRPHGNGTKVSVGFLDGHVAALRVSDITRAMITRDTASANPSGADETTLILPPPTTIPDTHTLSAHTTAC